MNDEAEVQLERAYGADVLHAARTMGLSVDQVREGFFFFGDSRRPGIAIRCVGCGASAPFRLSAPFEVHHDERCRFLAASAHLTHPGN